MSGSFEIVVKFSSVDYCYNVEAGDELREFRSRRVELRQLLHGTMNDETRQFGEMMLSLLDLRISLRSVRLSEYGAITFGKNYLLLEKLKKLGMAKF